MMRFIYEFVDYVNVQRR